MISYHAEDSMMIMLSRFEYQNVTDGHDSRDNITSLTREKWYQLASLSRNFHVHSDNVRNCDHFCRELLCIRLIKCGLYTAVVRCLVAVALAVAVYCVEKTRNGYRLQIGLRP